MVILRDASTLGQSLRNTCSAGPEYETQGSVTHITLLLHPHHEVYLSGFYKLPVLGPHQCSYQANEPFEYTSTSLADVLKYRIRWEGVVASTSNVLIGKGTWSEQTASLFRDSMHEEEVWLCPLSFFETCKIVQLALGRSLLYNFQRHQSVNPIFRVKQSLSRTSDKMGPN